MDENKQEEIARLVWEEFGIPPCLEESERVGSDIFYRMEDLGRMFPKAMPWEGKGQLFRAKFGLRSVFNAEQATQKDKIDERLLHALCEEFSNELVDALFSVDQQ